MKVSEDGAKGGGLPPIVSLVGKSGAGKTTFMEKLIPALVRRGYAVGTIKHHSHCGFDIDVEGKDSWRHKKAGARQVIVSCPDRLALVRDADHDAGLAELREAYCRGHRIGEVVGRPAEIVSRNSYAEASGLLERREIDVELLAGPVESALVTENAVLLRETLQENLASHQDARYIFVLDRSGKAAGQTFGPGLPEGLRGANVQGAVFTIVLPLT